MTMRIDSTSRNAACDAVVDLLDVGTTNAGGKLQLWSGSKPTNVGDAPGGTKLAEFDLPDPAFGDASSGQATANSISDTTGLADGTVGFARALDRDETARWDNDDVGTSGSNQIELNTTDITNGGTVGVDSWTVTMPAS